MTCLLDAYSLIFAFLTAGSKRTVSYTFFVSEVAVSPWDVVRQFAPPPSVVCVENMKNIKTDFGKVKWWTRDEKEGEGRGGEERRGIRGEGRRLMEAADH